uniref:Putative sulfotransferase n=1 Tax=Rhipicephalus microplus TaxID=6941 RepID=A0A6M2CHZ7_RHIMP
MDFAACRDVDGLWIHDFFHEDLVRSALAYKPREDDLFLATYPKCGTTWTQYLILSILTDGHPPRTAVDFMLASPFMEMMGAEAADRMVRPGLLKTHLPFNLQPYSPQAKYIYVTRNPYDVCVSFYYHMKSMTAQKYDASFDRFCKLFIAGKLSCGDYFDHLLSWYEHRNDPNVLFFTYEEMKKDTVLWTLKIANFMGEQYGMKLREDPDLLRKVIDASSLKNMQGVFNEQMPSLVKDMLNLSPDRAIKSMEVYREIIGHDDEPLHKSEGFIRKGIVGDWKAHFTNEQIQDMKTWIAEKTKGSDVMSLWKHLDLP